jgi:hypothetical protein
MVNHSIPLAPHAPYSSYSIRCNFFLFPRLKITLKGRRTSRLHREKLKASQK